jgi:hypothetical protein
MDQTKKTRGVSLAKGPIALIGALLLAYGVTAFVMGGHSFALDFPSGTVNGKTWLSLEVNAWSSLLFAGAGVLLLISAPRPGRHSRPRTGSGAEYSASGRARAPRSPPERRQQRLTFRSSPPCANGGPSTMPDPVRRPCG